MKVNDSSPASDAKYDKNDAHNKIHLLWQWKAALSNTRYCHTPTRKTVGFKRAICCNQEARSSAICRSSFIIHHSPFTKESAALILLLCILDINAVSLCRKHQAPKAVIPNGAPKRGSETGLRTNPGRANKVGVKGVYRMVGGARYDPVLKG